MAFHSILTPSVSVPYYSLLYFQAFQDLQGKMIGTTQQLKVSDMQIDALGRQIQHSKLVSADIKSLPADTKTYEGVGRM